MLEMFEIKLRTKSNRKDVFLGKKRHWTVDLGGIFVVLGESGVRLLPSECVWIQRRRRRRTDGNSSSRNKVERDSVQHSGCGQR